MQGEAVGREMSLAVAAEVYGVEQEDLYMMLGALDVLRSDPVRSNPLYRRMYKLADGSIQSHYLVEDIEAAISLSTARRLGWHR